MLPFYVGPTLQLIKHFPSDLKYFKNYLKLFKNTDTLSYIWFKITKCQQVEIPLICSSWAGDRRVCIRVSFVPCRALSPFKGSHSGYVYGSFIKDNGREQISFKKSSSEFWHISWCFFFLPFIQLRGHRIHLSLLHD